jgi:predicted transcriptional regulator of viral defense system
MEKLEELNIIPFNYRVLQSMLSDYKSPRNKIANLEKEGKIIRLKKGMYVVSPNISKKLLSSELIANHLYGPSYVSLESALRYYGLIPEQVFTTRSITINRSKTFENSIGNFEYISVKKDYYSIGIKQQTDENNYTFLIATPEKALCDMIVTTPNLRIQSVKALREYIEEDLRIEFSALNNMNLSIIKDCMNVAKKKEALSLLFKILDR